MFTAVKLIAAIVALATLTVAAPANGSSMPRPLGLKVIHAACPDSDPVAPMIGCAYPDGRVYLSKWADRFTRSHEIGHVFAAVALTDGDRHWFARVLRLPGVATWTDYKSEVFANVYATCDLRLHRDEDGSWPGGTNFQPPSVARMGRVCAAIKRVGRRNGAPH